MREQLERVIERIEAKQADFNRRGPKHPREMTPAMIAEYDRAVALFHQEVKALVEKHRSVGVAGYRVGTALQCKDLNGMLMYLRLALRDGGRWADE